MKKEAVEHPDTLRLVVGFLRSYVRMSQTEFGRAARISQGQISAFDTGAKAPTEDALQRIAAATGVPWPLIAPLRHFISDFLTLVESGGSIQEIEDPFDGLAVRSYLLEEAAESSQESSARLQLEAETVWAAVADLPPPRRRRAVELSPRASRNWALARLLCQASERAAAHDPREALELADLALSIAERVEEGDAWRSRLSGYAWAFKGNGLRVAGHLDKAGEAIARAWRLWNAGASLEPHLLPEWQLLSLEASLRREEHRFAEALELLSRAAAGVGREPADLAAVLLKKEFVHEQMGDPEGALAALAEAAPCVAASGEARLFWVLHFETAKVLCALGQTDMAESALAAARDQAERLGNDLDLVRVDWLAARIAAGQGRRVEALAGLEQVRRQFVTRAIPYDAALASLELAVLYLEEGRTGDVKDLAREMAPIFQSQGIAREALASLTLFVEAAQKEIATVELVRRVVAEIEGARRTVPRSTRANDGKH